MNNSDPLGTSERAIRQALAAMNRGDEAGARLIADAHAADVCSRPQARLVLVMPLCRARARPDLLGDAVR